jgi:hypothetical protein
LILFCTLFFPFYSAFRETSSLVPDSRLPPLAINCDIFDFLSRRIHILHFIYHSTAWFTFYNTFCFPSCCIDSGGVPGDFSLNKQNIWQSLVYIYYDFIVCSVILHFYSLKPYTLPGVISLVHTVAGGQNLWFMIDITDIISKSCCACYLLTNELSFVILTYEHIEFHHACDNTVCHWLTAQFPLYYCRKDVNPLIFYQEYHIYVLNLLNIPRNHSITQ